MCPDFRTFFQKVFIFLLLLRTSLTSECDVEFTYSEYYNSNGFKVTCRDIAEGQQDIIRYISAQSAIILEIRNTTLVNVTSDLFENVPKLKELKIENSRIFVSGTVDLFSKLESLQTLILKDTVVKDIGNATFNNLLQIRTLHLENNSLSFLAEDSLKMYTLDSLYFVNNDLKNVDDIPLCYLDNLEMINLSGNKIKNLKPNLYKCGSKKSSKLSLNSLHENNHLSVESLDLSNNQISSLLNAFESFTNLNILNLANNSVSRITDTDFENLSELEELNLSNNSITFLSTAAFSKLISLRELHLSRNKITRLKLTSLTKLTKVDLSHNQLTFDSLLEMKNLSSLKNLDISFNKLNGSSGFFNNFPSLKSLNLNSNNLILEEGMFKNLSTLEILYVRDNGILYLPGRIFQNMTSLRKLDLSMNKLTILDNNELFSSLLSVQVLNLSYNNLKYLNHNLFSNLDDCEILDIAGNKLRDLDYPYIINSMRSLETINIRNNKFSCNFLHNLIRYFSWKNIKYSIDSESQYNEENIGGIQCEEEIKEVTPVRTRQSTTSFFVISLIAAIFSVFVLLVILIIKYYQIYKRSKYHSEQFELISE